MVRNPTWGPSKVFPINKGFSFIVNKIGERSMNHEYTSRGIRSLFSSPCFLLLLISYSFITRYQHETLPSIFFIWDEIHTMLRSFSPCNMFQVLSFALMLCSVYWLTFKSLEIRKKFWLLSNIKYGLE